ncbi:MAG: hypothetical protein RDV48_12020 [Candidatus Eremiobacteraeota bacterium]|nr:hypothetical protein [Candidatus Eremiobacteraeota bacterium]
MYDISQPVLPWNDILEEKGGVLPVEREHTPGMAEPEEPGIDILQESGLIVSFLGVVMAKPPLASVTVEPAAYLQESAVRLREADALSLN